MTKWDENGESVRMLTVKKERYKSREYEKVG